MTINEALAVKDLKIESIEVAIISQNRKQPKETYSNIDIKKNTISTIKYFLICKTNFEKEHNFKCK